jgi:ATP-dependent RNA helicase RhlB
MLKFFKRSSKKNKPSTTAPDHAARESRQKIEVVKKSKNEQPKKVSSSRPEKLRTDKPEKNNSSPQKQRKPYRKNDNSSRIRNNHSQREETKRHSPMPHHEVSRKIPPMPEIVESPAEEGKMRFTDMDIEKPILAACQDLGFNYCTPIQEKALPTTLQHIDLTGKAQTGTGKTAAFLISAIDHMLRNPHEHPQPGTCRMLVLAPTRELAIQIHKDAEELSNYTSLRNIVVFGGMNHEKQREQLSHPVDIVVGTPGRIIDYTRSNDLKLGKAEILVIDEADRMLDMGFIPDVRRIVSRLPQAGKRQTMFFSATFDPKILRLVESWLSNPISVEVEPENIVSGLIEQTFYSVTRDKKLNLLNWFLENDDVERMLIFVNRKDMAQNLTSKLHKKRITCGLLSGDVPQKKRLRILEDFRAAKIKVVVATDVAARGIHVDNVSHVVNYDLPYEAQDYVHRIGRTGRAGKTGKSISFLCEYGSFMIPDLEEILGHTISSVQPEEEMVK